MRREPNYDVDKRMGQLYQPQTRAINEFNTLLSQYPTNQKPSMLRRIGAALAGFGAGYRDPQVGIQVGYQLREQPNIERKQEWAERLKAVEPAMQAERYYNVNARQLASDTVNRELTQRKLDITEENNRKRAEIAEKRALAYQFKVQNPDYELSEGPGPSGNLMWIAPNRPPIDSGIKPNEMTQEAAINLRGKWAVSAARERGMQTRMTQENEEIWDTFQQPDGSLIQVERNSGRPRLVDVPKGTRKLGTGSEESEQSKRIGEFRRALELYNSNPEFAEFISVGSPGPNDFVLAKPGINWITRQPRGPTAEQFRRMFKYIYGRDPQPAEMMDSTPTSTPTPTTRGKGTPPPINQRTVGMEWEFANGNIGRWNGTQWVPVQMGGR